MTPPSQRTSSGLSRMFGAGIAIVLILIAAGVGYYMSRHAGITDGVVDGQRAVVTARFKGQIGEVRAAPGAIIRAGDVILSYAPMTRGIENPAEAQALIKQLQDDVIDASEIENKAREDVGVASLLHAKTMLDLRSAGAPVPGSAESEKAFRGLRDAEEKARGRLAAMQRQLERASNNRYSAEVVLNETRNAIRRGNADARPAQQIVSPMDGRIGHIGVQPGQIVESGETLAVIEPVLPEHFWVRGSVRASEATRVHVGDIVRLAFADAKDFVLDGQVEEVQIAGQGDVPVRVRIIGYDPTTMPQLRLGQRVDVSAR